MTTGTSPIRPSWFPRLRRQSKRVCITRGEYNRLQHTADMLESLAAMIRATLEGRS